jgi:hypothetical protein
MLRGFEKARPLERVADESEQRLEECEPAVTTVKRCGERS